MKSVNQSPFVGSNNDQSQTTIKSNPQEKEQPLHEYICSYCKENISKLLACARCKKVYYCDIDCQKSAWKVHKTECLSPKKKCFVPFSYCKDFDESKALEIAKEFCEKGIHNLEEATNAQNICRLLLNENLDQDDQLLIKKKTDLIENLLCKVSKFDVLFPFVFKNLYSVICDSKVDDTKKLMEKAIQLLPQKEEKAFAHYKLAEIYCFYKDDRKTAIIHAEKAKNLDPENIQYQLINFENDFQDPESQKINKNRMKIGQSYRESFELLKRLLNKLNSVDYEKLMGKLLENDKPEEFFELLKKTNFNLSKLYELFMSINYNKINLTKCTEDLILRKEFSMDEVTTFCTFLKI